MAEEQERLRIATELRDSTSQTIAALQMNLGVLKKLWASTRPDALLTLDECLVLAKQCEQEVRIVSHLLYPPLLDEFGLASSLRYYLAALEKRKGLRVRLTMKMPARARLPKNVEITLFRIVQECLSTARLPARNGKVQIALYRQGIRDQVRLVINCAAKLPAKNGTNRTSHSHDGDWVPGIEMLKARVRGLGGELVFKTAGAGIALQARMPVRRLAA